MKIYKISSELEDGIKVEKEHSDIFNELKKKLGKDFSWTLEEFAKKVAEAHLEEIPDYYKRLKVMEDSYKGKLKN